MIKRCCFYLFIPLSILQLQASSGKSFWQEWRKEVFQCDLKRPSAIALNIKGDSTIDIFEEKESDSNVPSRGIRVLVKDLDYKTWYEEKDNTVFVENNPLDAHFKNHYKVIFPFKSETKIFLRAALANIYTENSADMWAHVDQGKLTVKNSLGQVWATIGQPGEDRTSFEIYNPRNHVSINAPNARGLLFSLDEPSELLKFALEGRNSAFHWYPPYSVAQDLPETLELKTREDHPFQSSSFPNYHLRARGTGTSLTIYGHSKARHPVYKNNSVRMYYKQVKSAKILTRAVRAAQKVF